MSGDNEAPVSGWTVDTLYQHLVERSELLAAAHRQQVADLGASVAERFADMRANLDERHTAQQAAVYSALGAAERAVEKAEVAADKRFECVASDVLILCSDLVWRPAGDLLPGDELIACDETAPTRRGRRFRLAVVTANEVKRDVLLRVTTSAGSVRCNSHHPWLTRRDSTCKPGRSHWQWVKTADLRPGDSVLHALDTWDTDRSWEAGWLAGIYDGEGCLSLSRQCLQLTISRRESATSDRIAAALKERIGHEPLTYRLEPGGPSTPANTQPFFHFMVSHRPDVMKILGSVRPPRLLERADGTWDGQVVASHGRAAVVTSVEGDGTGMIAALSTSTHTYIADGFIMHNSVNEFRQQLSDQTATFPSRGEVDTRIDALREQTETNAKRIAELELRLTSRLDTEQGSRAGGRESRVEYRAEAAGRWASNGQIMQFAGLVLLALAIVASVLIAVLH